LIGWKNGMNQYSLGSATIADPKTMMEIEKSNGSTVLPLKTTAEIAKDIGLSETSAQRRMQAARNILPEVKEAIRNTEIPTASVKIRSVKLIKGMYLAISTA